jgi:predicted RNase H-like HicB family nuclease
MDKARIAKMANKVAQNETEDEALANVDQAIDAMISAAQIIDTNLSKVKTENVPQKAAVDAVQDLMDTAIAPYLADIAKAMQVFPD